MAKRKKYGAPTLQSANNVIVKKSPRGISHKRLYYFAHPSNPKGATPSHLVPFRDKFTAQAPKCAAEVRGMPPGPEKVLALRGCMKTNLSTGRPKRSGMTA
jgi:hypothetical protein